jgi:hypothetical protein
VVYKPSDFRLPNPLGYEICRTVAGSLFRAAFLSAKRYQRRPSGSHFEELGCEETDEDFYKEVFRDVSIG